MLLEHIGDGPCYAYPLDSTKPLSLWTTHRIAMNESSTGSKYWTATVDGGQAWLIFQGTSQPANYAARVAYYLPEQIVVSPTIGTNESIADLYSVEVLAPIDADYLLARSVIDANGDAVTLPSCYVALADEYEQHLVDLTPTITGSSYSVTIPRSYTTVQRSLFFSLRSTTNANTEYDRGSIRFVFSATESTI